jgi:ribosome biogenesis GTPase / thiamine phosphate phosphatase
MPALDLRLLGWDADVEAKFREQATSGLVPGRVALEHNHVYRVLTDQGEWLAEAAGRLKFRAEGRDELPAVGDWVGLRPPSAGGRAVIRLILPRRSRFSRKVAGREVEEQVIATNIDTVFLVASFEGGPNCRSIERYLVLARQSGARPVIVLNKADLSEDVAAAVSEVTVLAGDTPVHAVSARDGRGFEWLESYLGSGRTIALLGPSGGGKSSIVNRLAGEELLATTEVRTWDARGRHTSVHRQLVVLDRGGVVIDTPGLRELQLWNVDVEVDDTFADIADLAGSCRFRDCRHEREPGCAVKAAVADGRLDAPRFGNYLKLSRERDAFDRLHDQRGQIEAKRQGRIGAKAYRAMQAKKRT